MWIPSLLISEVHKPALSPGLLRWIFFSLLSCSLSNSKSNSLLPANKNSRIIFVFLTFTPRPPPWSHSSAFGARAWISWSVLLLVLISCMLFFFQLSTFEVCSANVKLRRLFGYDQYVIESYTWKLQWASFTNTQQRCDGRSIDLTLIRYGLPRNRHH